MASIVLSPEDVDRVSNTLGMGNQEFALLCLGFGGGHHPRLLSVVPADLTEMIRELEQEVDSES